MNEHIYIKLKNSTAASAMLDIIDQIIYENDAFDNYTCDPVALTIETNRFATFIIIILQQFCKIARIQKSISIIVP